MLLAPLVGMGLGLAGCALLALADLASAPPLLTAVLTVALLAWLTRGLHWDGLADLADGLGSGAPRERALEIMKDPSVGAFGVLGLVLVLLTQIAALTALIAGTDGSTACGALVTAAVIGRLAVSLACVRGVPSARPAGLGAAVAGSVGRLAGAVAVLLVSVAIAGYGALTGVGDPWTWLAILICGLLVGLLTLANGVRRLGGVTGDVLGAVVELSTTGALVCAALLLA